MTSATHVKPLVRRLNLLRDPQVRTAGTLAIYAAVFGASFGAVATATELSLAQTMVLSLVLSSGASQFAFVGVVAAGGPVAAAGMAALLLGLRNTFYGPAIASRVPVRGWRRWMVGMTVLDETAAVVMAQSATDDARRAFRLTAVGLYVAWGLGTFVGALAGEIVDPHALGLDAVGPVVFLALLWPALSDTSARWVAVTAGVVGLASTVVVPAGAEAVVAALVGVAATLIVPEQS